jgi:hypothetical protein
LLEVDVKEGFRKKLESALEANPHIRESLGLLFQTAVPLDVQIKDIAEAKIGKKGQVQIVVPHRKDVHIPLDEEEAKKLIAKLNELIPIEKQREIERMRVSASVKAERELRKATAMYDSEESERLR